MGAKLTGSAPHLLRKRCNISHEIKQESRVTRAIHIARVLVFGLLAALFALPATAEQGLLWRVETAQGMVSHLFGTIHSDDPRVLDLPQVVEQAYAGSRVVVLEMDLGKLAPEEMAAALALPAGKELADLLPAKLYRDAVTLMTGLGYPEELTSRLNPWAVQMTLSMPPPSTGQFLDLLLYQQAIAEKKQVLGLESMAEQLAVFSQLTLADQIVLLREAVDEYPQMGERLETILVAWLQRDLDGLSALNEESMAKLPEGVQQSFGRSLLEDRNHRMAERSLPVLRQGGAFIAVGAMHLIGDEGIVELLRKQGMTVTAVY